MDTQMKPMTNHMNSASNQIVGNDPKPSFLDIISIVSKRRGPAAVGVALRIFLFINIVFHVVYCYVL